MQDSSASRSIFPLKGRSLWLTRPSFFDQLLHAAAQTGDMRLGGGEVVVHDDTVAGLDKAGGENVLTGTPLMGGQTVLDAEQLLELGLHTEEGLAASIGVVSLQHGRLLAVGHGVDAGIGKHVQKNVAVVQLEGVEPGLLHFSRRWAVGSRCSCWTILTLCISMGMGSCL